MANYDFYLDIIEGEEAEALIGWLRIELAKRTIEVKRDIYVAKSGNVAIEYECRGKPSGIAVSKANWWAIVLDGPGYEMEQVVFIKRLKLKRMCKRLLNTNRDAKGGDANKSKIILLPVSELVMKEVKIITNKKENKKKSGGNLYADLMKGRDEENKIEG